MKAAKILYASCQDENYTWVERKELELNGYNQYEAMGVLSSLNRKGFLDKYDFGQGEVQSYVTEKAYKFMHLLENPEELTS